MRITDIKSSLASVSLKTFCGFMALLAFAACQPTKEEPPRNDIVIEEAVDVPQVVRDPEEIIMRSEYATQGELINNRVSIKHEVVYRNGVMVREITSSDGSMVLINEYDDKGRVAAFRTEQNGKLSVHQINTYTEDDMLLSEYRLDESDNGYDTTLYEYHYPAERTYPLKYFRTNNGVRVTDMTLTRKGNIEIIEEQAASDDYVAITITTTTKNDQGKVTEETVQQIGSDWSDKTKLDTTVIGPSRYEYDNKGRIVKQVTRNILGTRITTTNFYSDDGALRKRVITKEGQPTQILNYKKV